jgi:hypothetical protein
MTKETPKKIIQTTRDGQTVTVFPSRGGAQVVIEPKADKYKKQD